LGSLPSHGGEGRTSEAGPEDEDLWGAPSPASSAKEDTDDNGEADESAASDVEPGEEDDDPDAADTAPTRIQTAEASVAAAAAAAAVKRDSLTDTGRHARIEIDDDPPPQRVAFVIPLDDPNEAPEGYPVKANTKSGVYWTPGSPLYDDAQAEIWFASEELARVNGFVTDAEGR
jgi:uncharacterized protein with LGFP repeats